MALQSSGSISMGDVCIELGLSPASNITLDDSRCRRLAQKEASGSQIGIGDLYGKSNFEYKAYIQNAFADFAPQGTVHPNAPVTWWVSGFRIESLNQSIQLNRMVGYDSANSVLFDQTATGEASNVNNVSAYRNSTGWLVENTEWLTTGSSASLVNAKYSLTCVCYYTREDQAAPKTVYRVVAYDTNGNQYPIEGHRNFSVQATLSALTTPNNPVVWGLTEIPKNN
jgi:hypothetical protein